MAHVLERQDQALAGAGEAGRKSILAPIDPRMRIVMTFIFAVVVVALSTIAALTAALLVALALLVLSRLPWRSTLKRMAMMDSFIIVMLLLLPFSVPGDPFVTIWGFSATWQGLWQAIEIALTANAVILTVMVLIGTLEPVTLGHALHRLRCPETLINLLMFTIRYIDVLHEEYQRLRAAMKVRGFRPGTNWHTYRSFGYLIGMMLVRAIERSERILGAMKCRGFSGQIFLLQDFTLTRRDIGFSVGLGALCLGLIVLDFA